VGCTPPPLITLSAVVDSRITPDPSPSLRRMHPPLSHQAQRQANCNFLLRVLFFYKPSSQTAAYVSVLYIQVLYDCSCHPCHLALRFSSLLSGVVSSCCLGAYCKVISKGYCKGESEGCSAARGQGVVASSWLGKIVVGQA
jgi:hypothetical protein